jgi:5-dehydro-2-deoxygluconokinase
MKVPVYLLAADHRWQWDEWCDAHSVDRSRIMDAKEIAFEGLMVARKLSEAAREGGALLIDQQYGGATLARALAAGVRVGTPAEKPGVFPLEWTADPFWSALPGSFAKVLIRYRPEWVPEWKRSQLEKLHQLAQWCKDRRMPLLLEVLIPRKDEPEEHFETVGRPTLLARVIAEAYQAGVVPDFWKIEGTTDPHAMEVIDLAIRAQPSSRLVILGKGAGFDVIGGWFRAAATVTTAAGFAIGRTVYWQPAADFLLGRTSREAATRAIAENYLRVISDWTSNVSGAARPRTSPPR